MTVRNYYHVGILVADLVTARLRFMEVTGLDFTEPATFRLEPVAEQGQPPGPSEVVACYSRQGEPYVELIQVQERGPYGLDQGEGVHHLGFWVPDVTPRLAELVRLGLLEEARGTAGGRSPTMAYTDPGSFHGVRLELVDERRRPALERWISG